MNISGSGTIPAGEYNEDIRVSGSGKCEGLIRCVNMGISGSFKAENNIECSGDLKVSGSSTFKGDVKADSVHISGSCGCDGTVTCNTFKSSGGMSAAAVKCKELIVSGSLKVSDSIEAEKIETDGSLKCGGLINAEDIEIVHQHLSGHAGSIGGGTIKIYYSEHKRGGKAKLFGTLPLFSSIVKRVEGVFEVDDSIEGDVIAIEGVSAKRVTGRVVAIGPGCVVDLVQYYEEIEIDPNAKVRESQKID